MHLELTDLRLFIRAANEGSFTRAAQRQHLSLPAASLRIKSLEKQIGPALFYRQARGVRLTVAGEAFLHHAKSLLRQVSGFDIMCRLINAGVGIGIVPESVAKRCQHQLPIALVD